MNEEIMNDIQPVRPKDQFTFSCRQCGACCRNIEGCVMVESLDAYRLARYLRAKGEPIEGIEDFLFRYCEPEPLTEEGFPIYMLKTKAPSPLRRFLFWAQFHATAPPGVGHHTCPLSIHHPVPALPHLSVESHTPQL